jgi:hypothetical protein
MLEFVNELRDAYKADMEDTEKENIGHEEGDAVVSQKNFKKKLKDMDGVFKDQEKANMRHLCTSQSFAQGLVMASRIHWHYTHLAWFKVGKLNEMVEDHGAVSAVTL